MAYHLVEPSTKRVDGHYLAACGRNVSKKEAVVPNLLERQVSGLHPGWATVWEFRQPTLRGKHGLAEMIDWCPNCRELVAARFHATFHTPEQDAWAYPSSEG